LLADFDVIRNYYYDEIVCFSSFSHVLSVFYTKRARRYKGTASRTSFALFNYYFRSGYKYGISTHARVLVYKAIIIFINIFLIKRARDHGTRMPSYDLRRRVRFYLDTNLPKNTRVDTKSRFACTAVRNIRSVRAETAVIPVVVEFSFVGYCPKIIFATGQADFGAYPFRPLDPKLSSLFRTLFRMALRFNLYGSDSVGELTSNTQICRSSPLPSP